MAGNRKAKLLAFAITIFTLILLYNSIEMTSEFDFKPQPALRQDQAEFDEFSFEEFGTKNHRKSSMFFDKDEKLSVNDENEEGGTEENDIDDQDYDDEVEENEEDEDDDYRTVLQECHENGRKRLKRG